MPISQVPSEQFPCHVPGPAVKGAPVLEERKNAGADFSSRDSYSQHKARSTFAAKKRPWSISMAF
jgi:hypothetical protein